MEAESSRVDRRNEESQSQKQKIASLTHENEELRKHNELLKAQLRSKGFQPVGVAPKAAAATAPPPPAATTTKVQTIPAPDSPANNNRRSYKRKNYDDPVNVAALRAAAAAVEANPNENGGGNKDDSSDDAPAPATLPNHGGPVAKKRMECEAALAAGTEAISWSGKLLFNDPRQTKNWTTSISVTSFP